MNKMIDCKGMACPLPVVTAKKAAEELNSGDILTILVDNEIAVQNLQRFASHKGFQSSAEKKSDTEYSITMNIGEVADAESSKENTGAYLTCEDADTLEDLKLLESEGVTILTCGTCLDFYGLKEKLAVGGATNMYDIVERMEKAQKIIKP